MPGVKKNRALAACTASNADTSHDRLPGLGIRMTSC